MKKQIGDRVIQIRQNLEISRETLAERASLSMQQVTEIEDNKIIPSLAPLIRIARVLGVRLGTFLDDQEQIGPTICRKGQESKGISFSNNASTANSSMQYYPLAAEKSGRHMEPFIVEIKPNTHDYSTSTHEGEEFIYVMAGEIEIEYGNEKIVLKEGDSIYYDSIVPHHVHANGDTNAKILAVVYVPL